MRRGPAFQRSGALCVTDRPPRASLNPRPATKAAFRPSRTLRANVRASVATEQVRENNRGREAERCSAAFAWARALALSSSTVHILLAAWLLGATSTQELRSHIGSSCSSSRTRLQMPFAPTAPLHHCKQLNAPSPYPPPPPNQRPPPTTNTGRLRRQVCGLQAPHRVLLPRPGRSVCGHGQGAPPLLLPLNAFRLARPRRAHHSLLD